MPIISFDVPADKAQRIAAALGKRVNAASGGAPATAQQVRQDVIEYWKKMVEMQEKKDAAAQAEAGVPDLGDIT